MDSNTTLGRNELFAAIHEGKPFKSYIKTILGKVAVQLWDNFLDKPVDVILQGDPKRKEDTCIVNVFSAREDAFFLRVNKKHFATGMLIPYVAKEISEPVEKPIEQSTDDELKAIINKKFLALSSAVNKINSTAVLFRMRGLAEEMEKSEKITRLIESRISELQSQETTSKNPIENEED